VLQGEVQPIPLVGHLGQAHVRDAHAGRGRLAGHGGDLQRLPVGRDGRVQATLGALDLAEMVAASDGQVALAGRLPAGDAGREGALGLGQPPG
jgi:hypothetical protein